MTRNCFAGPVRANGPFPATARATTSVWAIPELTLPELTAITFAIEPSEARVETMRPAGPQTSAAWQRPTPGGWLTSCAKSCPTGK